MQEKFISTVTKIIERKVEDTQKKKAGWFYPWHDEERTEVVRVTWLNVS